MPSEEWKTTAVYAFTILERYMILEHILHVEMIATTFVEQPTIFAFAKAISYCIHPSLPTTLIPLFLYQEMMNGSSCFPTNDNMHMSVHVNVQPVRPFYFKTDGNVPSGFIDFVTLLLHESMHGLGFYSGFLDERGRYIQASSMYLYDTLIFRSLLNTNATPYYPLGDASVLTKEQTLMFNNIFQIYTPSVFAKGSSLNHASSINSLMYYSMFPGTAMHCLTSDCLVFLRTFGYKLHNNDSAMPCISSSSILQWMFG